ncbi:MAG: Rieske (2Fe-2S) protein [Leptolyngbyaceae cyanobacterium SL_7_1]|nr:Rieske (2Fe-2S) protein [Leptolyngbyaceae cyanobacterium SL_7_1]
MTTFYKTATTLRPGAMTLPAPYYTCQEIFAQELERIFYRRWVFVGRQEEIPQPGDYIVRTVGTEQLILLRDRQGDVRSFYNLCRHRGTRLCLEPSGHLAGTIRCPYHAWSFGLDGQLLSAPFMQAIEGFRREDFPLQPVETALWEGGLFVNLAPTPNPYPLPLPPCSIASPLGTCRNYTAPIRSNIPYTPTGS